MTSSPFSPTGQEPAPPGAAALLATAGVEGSFQLHALAGGANNRVFRVDVDDKAAADAAHRRLLLKSYFSHPDDPRDRLATEFAFARFAWERGIRALPQPIALSPEDDLGLYEFIDGRAFSPADLSDQATEIADRAINAALEFYDALNRHKGHPDAANLGAASEACFSLQDHLAQVDRRLQRLQGIDRAAAVHDDAMCFVTRELAPAWSDAAQTVRAGAKRWDLPLDAPLAGEQRCLSPSDFGFHNAIIDPAGVVRFFDFEYAGWDDPAKMVGDFFRQVKVPVPRRRGRLSGAHFLVPGLRTGRWMSRGLQRRPGVSRGRRPLKHFRVWRRGRPLRWTLDVCGSIAGRFGRFATCPTSTEAA